MAKAKPAPVPANEMALSTKALTLKGEIEACHREVLKSGNEMIRNAVRVGELLMEVQSVLKASKSTTFGAWVEQFLPFSERSARSYIKLHNELEQLPNRKRASVLESADSINEARRLIAAATKPDPKPDPPAPPAPPVVQGELVDDQDEPDDLDTAEPTDAEILGTAAEPIDRGKCPNCAGTKWTEDEDGAFCRKCNHPWGEPTGGVDEQRIADQRSKTIKTAEALLRAFDDLNMLLPKPEHGDAEKTCKRLVKVARAWK
jgi:hypothetical protein